MDGSKVARHLKKAARELKQQAKNLEYLAAELEGEGDSSAAKRVYEQTVETRGAITALLAEIEKQIPPIDRDPEGVAKIRAAFGFRPDLPPGEEYVREIRKIWAGLLERGQNG